MQDARMSQTLEPDEGTATATPARGGWLARERTIAPPDFNRWLIPPAALAIHLCIGQVYATSVYKIALVEHFGSSLTALGVVFSLAIVMLGLSAAVLGTWVDTGGPRRAMVAAALCWSAGFLVGAAGIATSQLWLLYLGYGVIGGIGLGIGYISPVSTLIKWFPDRPGLATGWRSWDSVAARSSPPRSPRNCSGSTATTVPGWRRCS